MPTTQTLIGVDVGGSRHQGRARRPRDRHRDGPRSGSRRRNPRRPTRSRRRSRRSSSSSTPTGPIGCTLPAVVVGRHRAHRRAHRPRVDRHARGGGVRTGDRPPVRRAERRRRGRASPKRASARRATRRGVVVDGHGRHRRRHRAARTTACSSPTPSSATSRSNGKIADSVGVGRDARRRSSCTWKQWAERLDTLPHAPARACSGPS